ncbi:MAG: YidC/Oxa1 family membrane protein insertase [Candidatus Pacebacteria bacterium]|nr:YidC/Oxa1 family membrane protein insertase [Candidatus Paceibacterota bacterium]MDD4074333.1 YidC/Oxa1 family membrane protein insertase [Candidatus Paceibacterota bacterium]
MYTNNFGIAVIILTVLVRLAMNPLNKKALESQKVMSEIQPKLKEIQTKYKSEPEKQAQEMLALYKEKKFNPFSSIFLLLIQIPIIIALFQIFKGGILVDPQYIYSFVSFPEAINPYFLGIDLSSPNLILAVIAAIAQFFQAKTGFIKNKKTDDDKAPKDQATQITEMMQKQMIFILPIVTLFVLSYLPSALGLYWIITTLMTIYQQKRIFNEKK